MNKEVAFILVILTLALAPTRLPAQGTLSAFQPQDTSYAPLLISTNGSGTITPYNSGQLLVVGQNYTLTATPAEGWLFAGWAAAWVFTDTEITINSFGATNPPIVSTIWSSTPGTLGTQNQFTFTMPSINVVYDSPGIRTLTQEQGFVANFVPVPEPATAPLWLVGAAAVILLLLRRRTTVRNFYLHSKS